MGAGLGTGTEQQVGPRILRAIFWRTKNSADRDREIRGRGLKSNVVLMALASSWHFVV